MDASPRLVIGNFAKSSWSMRPWVLMRALGLDFDTQVIRLDVAESRAGIAAHSPSGLVPCLVLPDGRAVWDSLAIIEHLAESHPGVWPQDPALRAHARCASAEMHAGFPALRTVWPMDLTVTGAGLHPGPAVRRDLDRVFALWSQALAMPRPEDAGPYLYGGFCAADAMFAPVVTRERTYGPAAMPDACRAYADRVWDHPAVRAWRDGAAEEAMAGWYA